MLFRSLWSSIETVGELGSGIAIKSDETPGFIGEYTVKYFVKTRESETFTVKIDADKTKNIYKLYWFLEGKIVSHGIGLVENNSLLFSWGDTDNKFDLSMFSISEKNGVKGLTRHIIKWDSLKIECCDYTGLQT